VSDEVSRDEEAVSPEQTDVVAEVVAEMRAASLEDLKNLPVLRKAQAEDFEVPGTGLTVKLAKCTGNTKYVMSVQQMQMVQTEDEDERGKMVKAMNNAIIKSCCVEPVLDDEAIEALNEFNADAVEALVARCVELSSGGTIKSTDLLESFSSGSQPTTN